ncbi:MAG: ArgP/LysG family DNA-binding transcriptional regulator [Microbacteriaceae bacterium]|jgi:LysR family transcriptional regulator (chromosome initiation inhibitor)|nr:ArgP/LysG family DNA-binding transcriptional regulator [Microbacteriaceae bacterium]MCI1207357.1 ArgP/LysG family DNA-binding transcriptional regulator [Microbacteriaceae bacterium]
MFFPSEQLLTLQESIATGSFETTATQLHITPSAVSQRIKSLEELVRQPLVIRSHPLRPTRAGGVLLRLAKQVESLTQDAQRELGMGTSAPSVPIAVNADSLASWVLRAVAPLADRAYLEFHRADEHHTGRLLRDGEVLAAITTEPADLPGSEVIPLGSMRYVPLASPGFLARWRHGAGVGWLRKAPRIDFDTDDTLPLQALRSVGVVSTAKHLVPSSEALTAAVRAGMGWSMVPEANLQPGALDDLRPVPGLTPIEIPLWWQQGRTPSDELQEVASAIIGGAKGALRRGPTAPTPR